MIKVIIRTFLLILYICSICELVECESEHIDDNDPNRLLPTKKRRPSQFSEKKYCDTCIHVITAASHLLFGKTSEIDILDVLDQIFNPLTILEYIPENLRSSAEHLISSFEDELIESLKMRKDDNNAIILACYQNTLVNIINKNRRVLDIKKDKNYKDKNQLKK